MEYNQSVSTPASENPEIEIEVEVEVEIRLADLAAAFATIPDSRHPRNRTYSLHSLLLALSAAILCNYLNVLAAAEWLTDQSQAVKTALGFRDDRTPHQTTLHRAFKKLEPDELEKALCRYFGSRCCDQPRPPPKSQ